MKRMLALVIGLVVLVTPALQAQDIPRPEHPDPMAVRGHWANLNGAWEFRFDPHDEGTKADWFTPNAGGFDSKIVVPFCWESELSGIKETSAKQHVGWYRRTFRVPTDFPKDNHVWLRFGAVDWRADVWVNGQKVGEHEGGYTPFELDITDAVKRDAENTLVVRAFDPTDPSLPTGKQVGWYTTTSGIWQTVWLEARPAVYIKRFKFVTQIEPARADVRVEFDPVPDRKYELKVDAADDSIPDVSIPIDLTGVAKLTQGASGHLHDTYSNVDLAIPNAKLWSPESPHLYQVTLSIKDDLGNEDRIGSYFALREIKRGKLPGEDFERVLLNGKPVYLRLALDQSFNPQGIYTAPSDEFLRKDIELAKSVGLNGLRIHIKPDEPRRLYWADKLGLLIMEDMPNTWRQNATARAAWEKTMREVVPRDRNHPSIFAWVAFNETWGLGRPDDYKADKDTQQWVKNMVAEIRTLDPTRLVEDNSPCNYDHVSGTDLNSWHFYIDNAEESRRHIEEVVSRSTPGSTFNYCPGETMNTAPLINSEYGSVSAGGGDRDISWGFRDLTTQLRKQNRIQGYVYTELTDIEWEHNGFANYDRSPKTFGYDAFVPNMTVADLQGADFVGYDAPPVIVAKPGETMRVPIFVSHYSDLQKSPTLRWWVTGQNDKGERDESEASERPVEWKPYEVVTQSKPIAFKIHGPFVGAVGFELVDEAGKRIAANFVNVVVKPEAAAPRVERLDDHHVALRFAPQDASVVRFGEGVRVRDGKVAGLGAGEVRFKLKVPETVAKAQPQTAHLHMEMASHASTERLDWPARRNAQDFPQTDGRTWPTSVAVTVDGQKAASLGLADEPADARGVLSHLNSWDHGSYGALVAVDIPLRDATRTRMELGQPIDVGLKVPGEGVQAGGLSIFGAQTGAYPIDATLILTTKEALPADLGIEPNTSVAVDTMRARVRLVLETAEKPDSDGTSWRFTTDEPNSKWASPEFDDSGWKEGRSGFGTRGTPGIRVQTRWATPDIWMRRTVELPKLDPSDQLTLRIFHDEDAEVYVNGQRLFDAEGYVTAYRDVELNDAQKALLLEGKNVIAVHCHQTGGGQGIDLGINMTKAHE